MTGIGITGTQSTRSLELLRPASAGLYACGMVNDGSSNCRNLRKATELPVFQDDSIAYALRKADAMTTMTIQAAVTRTCYKHSMGGGGGSYVKTVIPKGVTVEVIDVQGGFAKVRYNGKTVNGVPVERGES